MDDFCLAGHECGHLRAASIISWNITVTARERERERERGGGGGVDFNVLSTTVGQLSTIKLMR